MTLGDVKQGFANARGADNNLTVAASAVAQPRLQAYNAANETALTAEGLSALLSDILDALSPEELGRLPEPIWALLDFIAGFDDTEPRHA